MELRNCPECGRLFTYISVNLCPSCREKDEQEFIKVKEYLYTHPHMGIFELAEALEVDEAKIVRWVKEGRLRGKNYEKLTIPCERCGRPIPEGRFCGKCTNELAKGFSSLPEEKEVHKPLKHKFHTR